MKLLHLEVINFKSFVGQHLFHFPDSPGLYFMSGNNHDETRLEANGAGKSTIWDALTWLLYGTTSQGLKAGDVSSWLLEGKKKTTQVILAYLDSDGTHTTLRRSWRPNYFTIEREGQALEDLLADDSNQFNLDLCTSGKVLDLQAFLSSVYFAQGKQMFLDMSPSAKAAMFSDILSLDSWIEYSERSSDFAKSTESSIARKNAQIAQEQGKLLALSKMDLSSLSKEWEDQKEARRQALRDRKKATGNLLDTATKARADLDSEIVELEKVRMSQEQYVKSANQNLEQALQKKLTKYEIYIGAKVTFADLEKKLGRLKTESTCPTCGSRIRWGASPRQLDDAQNKYNLAKDELVSRRTEYNLAVDKYEAAKRTYEESRQLLYDTRDVKLRAKQDALRSAVRRCEVLDRNLEEIEDDLAGMVHDKNPYDEKVKNLEADIKQATLSIQGHMEDLDFLQETLSGYSWWVKGFKDVRLQQIQQALTQLEIEVNSSLVQLGLVGWALRFDVSKETKTTRKVSKGFHVMVESPEIKKPVPWESWSGGEAQRLRLAASLGLGNLMRSTYGITLPLEIWDEPTNYMSPMGVTDLLGALASRAQEERRQIWLVDHHTLGSSAFKGSVKITKKQGTSTVGALELWEEGE